MIPIVNFFMQTFGSNNLQTTRQAFSEILLTTSKNRTKIFRTVDRIINTGHISPHLIRQLPQLLNVSQDLVTQVIKENNSVLRQIERESIFNLLGAHLKIVTKKRPEKNAAGTMFFKYHRKVIRLPRTILAYGKNSQLHIVRSAIEQYLEEHSDVLQNCGRILKFSYQYHPHKALIFNLKGQVVEPETDAHAQEIYFLSMADRSVRFVS